MLRFALSAEAKSHLNAGKGEKLCDLKVGFWAKVNLSNAELMEKCWRLKIDGDE